MRQRFVYLVFMLVSVCWGCSSVHIFQKNESPASSTNDHHPKIEKIDSRYVKAGSVQDPASLQKGGKILVVLFKAGPNVEVNDQLDKVALSIVQGVHEGLSSQTHRFEVLTSENANSADYILEGHITEVYQPSRLQKLALKKNFKKLSIKGRLQDRAQQKTIAVFSDTVDSRNAQENYLNLGKTVGLHIGQFLSQPQ